jgi:hypothetical protein
MVGSTPGEMVGNVQAAGAPWVVSSSTARVRQNGRVEMRVRGLVVTALGTNPVPTVAAGVVCDGVLADTSAFVPFNTAGNARVRQTLTLPARCGNPSVLAIIPNGKFIAFSMPQDD